MARFSTELRSSALKKIAEIKAIMYFASHANHESVINLIMRKNQQRRSQAKANREKLKPKPQQESTKTPEPPSISSAFQQRANRWWAKLNRWWKWAAAVVSIVTTVLVSLPHFSISRETVNAFDPMTAQFRFTNIGWLPAWNVKFGCLFDTATAVPNGAHVGLHGVTFQQAPIPVVGHNESPVRGCAVSIPGGVPSGGIDVIVTYNIPLLWFNIRDRAYFSFRFDSSARGYVFVPDVKN
jgi:hypothetical protein